MLRQRIGDIDRAAAGAAVAASVQLPCKLAPRRGIARPGAFAKVDMGIIILDVSTPGALFIPDVSPIGCSSNMHGAGDGL